MTRLGALMALLCACAPPSTGASSRVTEARRQDLVIDVEVTGGLKAVDSDNVTPPPTAETYEFKIIRMAPEGARIMAGKEVVAFDPSALEKLLRDYENEATSLAEELGRDQAEANLARLNDQLELANAAAAERKAVVTADKPRDLTAELTLRSTALDRELSTKEVAYRQSKDRSNRRKEQAELAGLRDRLARAQVRVKNTKNAIADLSVKARRSGTVVYKQDWRGEKKKIGDSIWRGEAVLEIASLDRMAAQGQVDEVDASKVHKGQRVGLRLEAHPDVEYEGVVQRIDPLVRTESPESRVKVAQLYLSVQKVDATIMRPGMRFRGRIEVNRVPQVMQVPLAAVTTSAAGPFVMRVERGATTAVTVKLGRRSREAVEVLAGLREGDQVAVDSGPARSKTGSIKPGAL